MPRRSRIEDATARHRTIDRLYVGFTPDMMCTCGGRADSHEVKLLKASKRFAIRCVDKGCHCTTFSHAAVTLI